MGDDSVTQATIYGPIYPGEEEILEKILASLSRHQIEPDEYIIQNILQQFRCSQKI